ncbi:60S ribosomal protein L14 [Xylona heveae TC161]|uniref:60S ribosomal protein L14 n=1 Tax=Xylona heveae (strain CBS 132557 / TC161) TaxID=1328760 RepID=A0A165FBW9_XYLHT|nr:60S ribosomal protein L14 [Xylona heveae TC161]KZF20800.1 60S ribosomal protein L14 [Xylona heveae TC161]
MGEAEIKTSQWRLVEVGRVVLLTGGQYDGRLATVVEIVDHKRVLVDGPADDAKLAVPRQAIRLSDVVLTPIVIAKLPRAAGTGAVKAAWKKAEVEQKFGQSKWAKGREQKARRAQLTDFERFKVLKLRKQVRIPVPNLHFRRSDELGLKRK